MTEQSPKISQAKSSKEIFSYAHNSNHQLLAQRSLKESQWALLGGLMETRLKPKGVLMEAQA